MSRHPIQPVERDHDGVIRFKANKLVKYLLEKGPFDLNQLSRLAQEFYCEDDYQHLMQLIGYSVSGYGDLSGRDPSVLREADRMAGEL